MMKKVVPAKKGSNVTSPDMLQEKNLERKISDLSDHEHESSSQILGLKKGSARVKKGDKDEKEEKDDGLSRASGRNFIKSLQRKVKVPSREDDDADSDDEGDGKKHKTRIQRPPEPEVLQQPEYIMREYEYPEHCSHVLTTFLILSNGINFHLKEILCAAHQLQEYGEKATDRQFVLYYKWWADVCSLISCFVDIEDEIIKPFLAEHIAREKFNPKSIPESVTLLLQQNTISQFKLQIGKNRNKKLGNNTYLYTLDYFKQVQQHSELIVKAYTPLLERVLSESLQDLLHSELLGRLRDRKHFESLVWFTKALPEKSMRKEFVDTQYTKPEQLKYRVVSQVYNRKLLIAQEAIYMAKEVEDEYEDSTAHIDESLHVQDAAEGVKLEKVDRKEKAEKKEKSEKAGKKV